MGGFVAHLGVRGLLLAVEASPSEEPPSAEEAVDTVVDTIADLIDGFLANLPLIAIGIIVLVVGWLVARYLAMATARGLQRTRADQVVVRLVERLLRLSLLVVAILLALSIAGVDVGAALAGLGIAGLAVAFALQNILENFVAGLLLMVRKPFRSGDQIRTGDYEGTVEDIDLRVTRLVDYDGELVLIPNADVFRNPLINLTRRGARRSRLTVGIDYRDDHTQAGDIIREAVAQVEGVLSSPAPAVLLTALGESSVDFEIWYWTRPDIRTVRYTQDRVLKATKTAIETSGMTIPWPIRTLSFDNRLHLDREGA